MQPAPGGLVNRLKRVPGLGDAERFDLSNDLHLDEAARLLLDRFRQDNNTEAFTLLFELTHERLGEIASQLTRRLSPATDPDDLAQSFMARLFADLPRRDQPPVRRFLALAHTSMRNAVFDQLRQQRRAKDGGPRYHATLRAPDDPAQAVEDVEEDAVLQRYGRRLLSLTDECFRELDERDQNVLVAREILGMTYDRVAALLTLDSSQVGMIIRRARQHLADRIVGRLEQDGQDAGAEQAAVDLIRSCLTSNEHVKGVGNLVQRMLDVAAEAGRLRLADLVYEMAKSCLLALPEAGQRLLVHAEPRRRRAVADDVRDLGARLAQVGHDGSRGLADRVAEVAVHASHRETTLSDALDCLEALERLEGPSGRQRVAVALHHIHAQRLDEAEAILRGLLEADIPERTRQNVFRNLTLTLLRQDRWSDALEIAEVSRDIWPDDPVHLMNICYATARLGERRAFIEHVQRLVALHATRPRPTVRHWIEGELPSLADALGIAPDTMPGLVSGETTEGNHR